MAMLELTAQIALSADQTTKATIHANNRGWLPMMVRVSVRADTLRRAAQDAINSRPRSLSKLSALEPEVMSLRKDSAAKMATPPARSAKTTIMNPIPSTPSIAYFGL